MGLSSKDRAFNTKKVSYLDFKQLEMDRVLTALFARLAHNGFPSRLKRRFELSVEAFVDEFLEHPEWFTGFAQHREILERWVETHLMDVVNRGKANQAVGRLLAKAIGVPKSRIELLAGTSSRDKQFRVK